jgi:hypothetical protein
MKKLPFFTLVFLVWTGKALTQTAFPENGAVWKEEHITFAGPVFEHYALCGDTLLNGNLYSQVVRLQLDSSGQVANSTYLGALRSNGQQVRFFSDYESTEFLLYDFGLAAGNSITLYVPDLLDTLTRTVDSVKSEFVAGAMRRFIYFKPQFGGNEPEYWVEGIGSSYGLLGRGLDPIPDNVHTLWCYEHGSDYLNLSGENCELPELTGCSIANSTKFTSKGPAFKLSVSPNPSASRLKFFVNNQEGLHLCNLKIYAANGKILKVLDQVGQETPLPSDVQLSPGFYIAVLSHKENDRVMAHTTFVVGGE